MLLDFTRGDPVGAEPGCCCLSHFLCQTYLPTYLGYCGDGSDKVYHQGWGRFEVKWQAGSVLLNITFSPPPKLLPLTHISHAELTSSLGTRPAIPGGKVGYKCDTYHRLLPDELLTQHSP